MDQEQILKRIEEILSDKRLSAPTATVFENAPLALVQLSLGVELHTLQRVLGIERTNLSKLRSK